MPSSGVVSLVSNSILANNAVYPPSPLRLIGNSVLPCAGVRRVAGQYGSGGVHAVAAACVQMLSVMRDMNHQIYQPNGTGAPIDVGTYISYLSNTSPAQVNWNSLSPDIFVDSTTGYGVPSPFATLTSPLPTGTYTGITVQNEQKAIQQGESFILGWGLANTLTGTWQPNTANMTLQTQITSGILISSISVNSVPFALLTGTQLLISGGGNQLVVTTTAPVSVNAGTTSIPISSVTPSHTWAVSSSVVLNLVTGVPGPVSIPVASLVVPAAQSYSGTVIGPYPPGHDFTVDIRILQALYRYRAIFPWDTQFGTISDDGLTGTGWIKTLHDDCVASGDWTSETRGWMYFCLADIYANTNNRDNGILGNMTSNVGFFSAHYTAVASGPAPGLIYFTDSGSSQRLNGYANVLEQFEDGCALYHYATLFPPGNATMLTQGINTINYLWSVGMCQTSGGGTVYNVLGQSIAGITDGAGNFATPVWDSTVGDASDVYPGAMGRLIQNLVTTYAVTNDATLLTKIQAITDQLDYTRTTLPNNGSGPGLWDSTNLGFVRRVVFAGTGPSAVTSVSYSTGNKEAGRQSQVLGAFFQANQLLSNRYLTANSAFFDVCMTLIYQPSIAGACFQVNGNWTFQNNPQQATTEATGILVNVLLLQYQPDGTLTNSGASLFATAIQTLGASVAPSYFGIGLGAGTLGVALTGNTAYTSLTLQSALVVPLAVNQSLMLIDSGGDVQLVNSLGAAIGATTIPVTSFTAVAAFGVGSGVLSTPSVNDVALQNEIARVPAAAGLAGLTTGESLNSGYFGPTSAATGIYLEVGIFAGSTATSSINTGILMARAVLYWNHVFNTDATTVQMDSVI